MSWRECFDQIIVQQELDVYHAQSPNAFHSRLRGMKPLDLIRGTRSPAEALMYGYSYLHHHVGACRAAFSPIIDAGSIEQMVFIDFGCGPSTALIAFAQHHFERYGVAPLVRYTGLDTAPDSMALGLRFFECLISRGLIAGGSTALYWHPSRPGVLPTLDSGPVVIAFCYVLAHPFFNAPRSGMPDPLTQIVTFLNYCRSVYGRLLELIYCNPPKAERHVNWERLGRMLGTPTQPHVQAYDYFVYDSAALNGDDTYGSRLSAWQNQLYGQPARTSRDSAGCDRITLE